MAIAGICFKVFHAFHGERRVLYVIVPPLSVRVILREERNRVCVRARVCACVWVIYYFNLIFLL